MLAITSWAGAARAQPEQTGPAGRDASLRSSAARALPAAAGLSDVSDLTHYQMDLDIDVDDGRFTLGETIDYRNDTGQPQGEIVLRVYANTVDGPPPVHLTHAHCLGTHCDTHIDNATALTFRPAAPLAPGARIRMYVGLEGRLRVTDSSRTNMMAQGLEGMATLGSNEHHSDYGLLSVGDDIASFANFYAVIARRDASGWVRGESTTMGDLGSDYMSNVEATIRVDPDVTVVTTGITAERRRTGGRVEHHVVASMVRDFTVLASKRLTAETRQVGDVTIRSWFLPEERAGGERVLDVAVEAFRIFERRFGGYPYTELDLVEAPLVGGAGGVEFAGLVTVASMFYRDSGMGGLESLLGAGADPERMIEMVTAHEVAHQWWHGLVGSDSRAHPFIDESLAQWSALLYLEDRYGAARAREDGESQVKMNYRMMRMMGHPDAAVNQPVDAFDSSLSYAGLIYGKGVYVYPALRHAVGEGRFFAAVRDYVDRYRFQQAPGRGLVDVIADRERGRHKRRVETIARHWLDEAHGDQDIGRGSGGLFAALGNLQGGQGAGGSGGLDLNTLMQALGGGSGGASGSGGLDLNTLMQALGGAGGSGSGSGSGDIDIRQLERMLRELE